MNQDKRYYPQEGRYNNADFVRQAVAIDARYRLWRPYCLALCSNPTDADDLEQDAMMNAYQAADSFCPKADQVDGYLAWMSTIVRVQHLQMLRRQSKRPETLPIEAAQDVSYSDHYSIDADIIHEIMKRLSPKDYLALRLRLSGSTYANAASAMALSRPTQAFNLTRRAKSKLIQAIAAKDLELLTSIIPHALGLAEIETQTSSPKQAPHSQE